MSSIHTCILNYEPRNYLCYTSTPWSSISTQYQVTYYPRKTVYNKTKLHIGIHKQLPPILGFYFVHVQTIIYTQYQLRLYALEPLYGPGVHE